MSSRPLKSVFLFLGAALLFFPAQSRAQFASQAYTSSTEVPQTSIGLPGFPGLPGLPGMPGGGFPGPPGGGLPGMPGGGLPDLPGGFGGGLASLLKMEQIPKLATMVDRLKKIRDRLKTARDYLDTIRDYSRRDYLEMSPRNAMLTTLFGQAEWYDELEAGLEELQGISYTLNDIRDITEDVYPGDLPYNDPVEESLTQTTRKLSTMRNGIVTMRKHYEQMEEDKEVLENLALDNRDAEGRRQLMQTQTRVQLHQTKNSRMLRQQIATLTNVIATSETEKTNRRLQGQATRRKVAQQVAAMPWPEEKELPTIED